MESFLEPLLCVDCFIPLEMSYYVGEENDVGLETGEN